MSIAATLVMLGALSRRLGTATQIPPHYVWFYAAAALVGIGALVRLWHLIATLRGVSGQNMSASWVLIFNGLPALGITVGLIVTWRYWSWLLAERN